MRGAATAAGYSVPFRIRGTAFWAASPGALSVPPNTSIMPIPALLLPPGSCPGFSLGPNSVTTSALLCLEQNDALIGIHGGPERVAQLIRFKEFGRRDLPGRALNLNR